MEITSKSYLFLSENRLTGIIKDGNNIGYTYDSEDERVTKTINGVTVNYVYSGGLLAAEKDSNGSTIATYLYDDKGQPVSMTRSGVTYYYHYNAHGDTVALTDGSGNVAATYKYDIWGNITSKTGDIENPYTYGGQWGYIYDNESGLYFLMTRYYNPETGRFISKDRFAGFDNDPSSQNRYVYCSNDPVNNVDPTGYITIRLSNLQGTYIGRTNCLQGILNLILVTALVTYSFGSFGFSMLEAAVAGTIISLSLASWITIPMGIIGYLSCLTASVYVSFMIAQIIDAIAYTNRYKRYTITKVRKSFGFTYIVKR